MNKSVFSSLASVLFVFVFSFPAYAITLDDFEDGTQNLSASGLGDTAQNVASSSSAIGGQRSIRIESTTSAVGFLNAFVTAGSFFHAQSSQQTGTSYIVWDGDTTADATEPSSPDGLGGVDFTGDADPAAGMPANSFKLAGVNVKPELNTISLVFTVYDASDATGDTWSQKQVDISTDITSGEILVPFADFTTHGPNGAASFTNVGAVTLFIDGKGLAQDLDIGWFGTNGKCIHVPINGHIVDDCDVCDGNNEDKDDCGDCFGNNGAKDVCEICDGDGKSCLDCLGVPFGTAVIDDCGVCDGNNNDIDDCGVCGGGNTDKDICGICGGDGSTCVDCLGVPNGTAVIDDCGVCDGQNQQKGCDGKCFSGKVIDECEVCGGDGTSCLEIDCTGEPGGKAEIDRCGVCGGDGHSYLGCVDTNSVDTIKVLNKTTRKQTRYLNQLLKMGCETNAAKKQRRQTAQKTVKNSTKILSTYPESAVSCSNDDFCVHSLIDSDLDGYIKNSKKLYRLSRRTVRKFAVCKEGGTCEEASPEECKAAIKRRNKAWRRLDNRARRLHEENVKTVSGMPRNTSACCE